MAAGERRARRLLVIYNPAAGPRRQGRFRRWLAALRDLGATVTLAETQAPNHAMELARAADPARFDAVAVAGGDGTINEAVNGIFAAALPLAILPLGTANVLAAELGLPRSVGALAQIAAFAPARPVIPGEILSRERTEPWRFLLMAGIGFDAEVVAHIDLAAKRRLGKLVYVAASLALLARYRAQRFDAVIDGAHSGPASLVVARAHFYGGRFVLAPKARLDRPALYAVSFPKPGRGAALRYLAAVVTRTLACQRDVAISAAASIELGGPAGAPVQVDGDIRAHLPARIRLAERPIEIVA